MNVKHLDHLNLTVSNLDRTISWYQNLFGFEVKESGVYDGIPWAIIQSGDALLCLYERPTFELKSNDQRRKNEQLGINHFSFRITNEKNWLDKVDKHKPKMYYGGSAVEYPHSRSWYVKDPDSYEIEVVLWQNDEVKFS